LFQIKERLYDYFSTISIPGVPGIFTANYILLKILWSVVILGLVAVGFWNIALAVNDFYNYDVITNIKRVTPDEFTFPAITLCSDGHYDASFFDDNDEFVKSEDKYSEKLSDLFFDKVLFKKYDHKSSRWIELNVTVTIE
jgi:hypothetical protein